MTGHTATSQRENVSGQLYLQNAHIVNSFVPNDYDRENSELGRIQSIIKSLQDAYRYANNRRTAMVQSY